MLVIGAAAASVATACTPPSPAVPGNAADFSINVWSGWVQRWNPCAAVDYRVNVQQAPAALAAVQSAVGQLSKATGITFAYRGTTTYIPRANGWGSQPASLVIGFARHNGLLGGSNLLTSSYQLGEGGFQSSMFSWAGRITSYKITKGYVVLDTDGFNRASAHVKTAVLLHELGHAVGLNHARFSSEVMYSSVSNGGPDYYSAGDLAGLRKLGRGAGCLS